MSPDAVRRLAAAGLTVEQIAVVIEVTEADFDAAREKAAAKREATRQRQIKSREARRHTLSQTVTVTERDTASKPNKINGRVTLPVSERPIPIKEEVKIEGEEVGLGDGVQGKPKRLRSSPLKRPSRLADDWAAPDDWVADAVAETGLTDAEVRTEARSMRDHFLGKGKPMADWRATFRNWMRRSMQYRQQHRPLFVANTPQQAKSALDIIREQNAKRKLEEENARNHH
jgi:hypothetical protein